MKFEVLTKEEVEFEEAFKFQSMNKERLINGLGLIKLRVIKKGATK